jgi:type I restriction enzyme M protein
VRDILTDQLRMVPGGDFVIKDGEVLVVVGKEEDIRKIADTYHAWRGDKDCQVKYADIPGFCKSATIDDIRGHNYILTPGRYVGAAEVEDDGEPFEEKMARLTAALREQTEQAKKLDQLIWANLEDIGYGE